VKDEPQHEEWARRASQEHMVQARVRTTQAATHLVGDRPIHALTMLVKAMDHLIQALAKPEQRHDIKRQLHEAFEAGVQTGSGFNDQGKDDGTQS
jgi:hypothetical protein